MSVKTKRQGISKKLRFEVFKRDKFTCQYCGEKSPDVVLQLDHLHPHSKGGSDTILNLVTSCVDCNSGKSDRTLSDHSVLARQHAQLSVIQERKEQLQMMYKWQRSLLALERDSSKMLSTYWSECVPGYHLLDSGLYTLRKLMKKFDANEIMIAMRIAADHYLSFQSEGVTQDSVNTAWSKVGGICYLKRLDTSDSGIRELYYIRGILRNRLCYINMHDALNLLVEAHAIKVPVEELTKIAKEARNWTSAKQMFEDCIGYYYDQLDTTG